MVNNPPQIYLDLAKKLNDDLFSTITRNLDIMLVAEIPQKEITIIVLEVLSGIFVSAVTEMVEDAKDIQSVAHQYVDIARNYINKSETTSQS
jgi:hypothetical protein